jgi:phosphoglycolate phosphatase-like HAD superfamily hydrolase
MIKLVAFDWNGTIIADTQAKVKADNAVLKHFKLVPINLTKVQENFQIPIQNYWTNLGFSKAFFRKNAVTIGKIWHKNYEPLENLCRSRSGVKNVLCFLRKYKINTIVFSNHPTEHIEAQLKRLKLNQFFSKIIGRPKHKNALFKRNKELQLNAYLLSKKMKSVNIITVGDTDEEVQIAKNSGYVSVALTGGYQSMTRLKKEKPDYLIYNLNELKKIIKELNSGNGSRIKSGMTHS